MTKYYDLTPETFDAIANSLKEGAKFADIQSLFQVSYHTVRKIYNQLIEAGDMEPRPSGRQRKHPLPDKEALMRDYYELELPVKEIIKRHGLKTYARFYNALRAFGLDTRGSKSLPQEDIDAAVKDYVTMTNLTVAEISNKHNISIPTIIDHVVAQGYELRHPKKSLAYRD